MGRFCTSSAFLANNDSSAVYAAQIGASQFAHAYDFIGNQTNFVANSATNSYTHNALNQVSTTQEISAPSASLRDIFPAYDNNGNITKYIDESGNIVATYEYNAFGKTISQSGSLADFFRHRFSTKYFDSETSLYYYGYRFYSPTLMRWLNRDPIEEAGGLNLYGFCGNGSLYSYDPIGEQRTSLPGIILDSLCEDAYRFAKSQLQTAQERLAWDRYTKHGGMHGSRDIELSPSEVKFIAESIGAVVQYIKAKRDACRTGTSYSESTSIGGSAPSPWIKAIGGVSIKVSTRCNNGCFSYAYGINDLYDFDIKGVPGFTSRDWRGELGTIGVNLSGSCLQCGWQTFYHKGTFYGK